MSKSYAVQETISHGETEEVRYIETDLSADSVVKMLNSCSYLKLPVFSEDSSIVLQSRTQDEVLADRDADAARVARELSDEGVSEIGWVRYEVIDAALYASELRNAGWNTDQILGAGD